MSNARPSPGSIGWTDLTVGDAESVRQFYETVVGWRSSPVAMGEYQDYCMESPADGRVVAGICHARGVNAELPPCWLIYITVEDLDVSVERCRALGGETLQGPRQIDGGRIAVIRDPAGAVAALFQPSSSPSSSS